MMVPSLIPKHVPCVRVSMLRCCAAHTKRMDNVWLVMHVHIIRVGGEGVGDDAARVHVPRQVVHEQGAVDDLEAKTAVFQRNVAVVALLVLR